jgi:hypothetical protein
VSISLFIPARVRDELERRAGEAERTLSGQVRLAIREHLARADDEESDG